MIKHKDIIAEELRSKIRQNEIHFGGNEKLKIYGTLQCKSGRQMKKENRVFFASENEAKKSGFRPCGRCIKNKYRIWKENKIIREDVYKFQL